MKLDANDVNKLFRSCLDESASEHICVEGITVNVGLARDRVVESRDKIKDMLSELPEQFHKSGGGGWSFLNACNDRHGRQWGQHENMQELFLLGMAAGYVRCHLPKDMWSVLPGGMPYYGIDFDGAMPAAATKEMMEEMR